MNLATIGWPSGTDTGWPSEPRNMLPGRVEGFPAGVQASANTAERLLSQAVGWWDASQFRDGDRFLRNRGVAGDLLDLRLGSSVVANSNDPLFLAPEDTGYVYLPGVAYNFLSVPDEAALDITGDIDIRCRVALDNWSSVAPTKALVSKRNALTNQRGYAFLFGGGILVLRLSGDGTTETDVTSSANVAAANGDLLDVRATWRASDGRVQFFTSTNGGANWTQLGSDRTIAIASIYANTALFEIGSSSAGVGLAPAGKFYRAQVLDGIDGTTVLDVDCDAITSGSQTSFTAVTGQTVTINRSTSGRKSVAVPSRGNRGGAVFLFGTDDYMQVTDNWQHSLLNFDASDSFTVLAVVRRWATPLNNMPFVGKATSVSPYDGYQIMNYGTSALVVGMNVYDGSTSRTGTLTSLTLGDFGVIVGIADRSADTQIGYVNAVAGTTGDITGTGSLANTYPLRVGKLYASGGTYGEFEFIAAAIFRRALTSGEIATLNSYFQGRIA